MSDPIKPSHYHDMDGSNIHCHHAQLAQMGIEYMIGYHWGNIIKYVWRWQRKNGIEDLKKAEQHIKMLLEMLEKNDGQEKRHGEPKVNTFDDLQTNCNNQGFGDR